MTEEGADDLFEEAPCGYLVLTADGTVARVNRTFLSLTGFRAEELVGRRTLSSLLSAGGRMYYETHLRPLLHVEGRVREIALELVAADGFRVPVLVNASRTDDGHVRVVVFAARERREYERELLRARRSAEESEARARGLARTLQESLIPPTPPRVPGLDISAVYRPAGDGHEVGGDFYDVFQVGHDDWVVVLGDVCGKGVEAATVTLLVRHTIRALSVTVHSPAQILHGLNDVLLAHPADRFCTAVLLRLRRTSGTWRLDVAAGGHPLPLVVSGDEATTTFGRSGSLIGVLDDPRFDEVSLPLTEQQTVVLYTDGVTEARRGPEFFGEESLRQVVRAHAGDVDDVTGAVLRAVLDFQGDRPRDDIAVVAIRSEGDPSVGAPPGSSGVQLVGDAD